MSKAKKKSSGCMLFYTPKKEAPPPSRLTQPHGLASCVPWGVLSELRERTCGFHLLSGGSWLPSDTHTGVWKKELSFKVFVTVVGLKEP